MWDFLEPYINGPRYKQLHLDTLDALDVCVKDRLTCLKQKHKLDQENEQLKLLVPRPTPPEVEYTVEKDSAWVQSVVDSMGANVIRLPLGNEFRLTNKETFIDIVAWSWVDSFQYHKFFRCGNFTIAFKADVEVHFDLNQVGIVLDYKASHAYNLIIFPNGKVMLLEPQADQLFYVEDRVAIIYVLEGSTVII